MVRVKSFVGQPGDQQPTDGQQGPFLPYDIALFTRHMISKTKTHAVVPESEYANAPCENSAMTKKDRFYAGDWVEIRSKEEILQTLDRRGQLEGLPFMPQMFNYCGKRFRVYKRAHKTCDTVNNYKGRRMNATIHLEGSRCDGRAYGGCEAACLIYWKEAWVKKVAAPGVNSGEPSHSAPTACIGAGCTEEDVWAGTRSLASADPGSPDYVCQATQVPAATHPLAWWDLRQYLEDLSSGNIGLGRMLSGFVYMGYRALINAGIGLGRPLRWLYDAFQSLRGGVPYPRRVGRIAPGTRTPAGVALNLQAGDWVRVKSYDQILATLDASNRNRGLYFDAEMVPYCGRTFRVLRRVNRIVDEKTGKMTELKNPCVVLEGVVCQARYSECRLFCPRAIYSYWREIWLEKATEPQGEQLKQK
jgi:hypothetical protein